MSSLLSNLLSKTAACALKPTAFYQQVRFARKTIKLNTSYGRKPLITRDDYDEQSQESLENLAYEQGGRKNVLYDIMQDTFYHIKMYQLKRLRKHQEAEAKALAAGKKFEVDYDLSELETNPLVILKRALKNSQPKVITRKVKRGGAVYQVPFPISASEAENTAIKWIEYAVKDRPKPRKRTFAESMAQELIDAALERGKVIKKRDDVHRLADANKAYAHYRWG